MEKDNKYIKTFNWLANSMKEGKYYNLNPEQKHLVLLTLGVIGIPQEPMAGFSYFIELSNDNTTVRKVKVSEKDQARLLIEANKEWEARQKAKTNEIVWTDEGTRIPKKYLKQIKLKV